MKLISNVIAMGCGARYAEALSLARKAGLTTAQVDSVIRPRRMSNGFYGAVGQYALHRDETAHRFAISNAAKDMAYLANLAVATGTVNPMQAAVSNACAAMAAEGRGHRYVPMPADFIAARNGLPPPTEAPMKFHRVFSRPKSGPR